jgi:hypothetical protein
VGGVWEAWFGEMEIFDLGDRELGCAGGQSEEMVNEVKIG